MPLSLCPRPRPDGISHLPRPARRGIAGVHEWFSSLVTGQGFLPMSFELPAFDVRELLEARVRVQQGTVGRVHIPLDLVGKENQRPDR